MAQGALQVGITSVRLTEKLAEISEISGTAMVALSSRASVGMGSRIIGKQYYPRLMYFMLSLLINFLAGVGASFGLAMGIFDIYQGAKEWVL